MSLKALANEGGDTFCFGSCFKATQPVPAVKVETQAVSFHFIFISFVFNSCAFVVATPGRDSRTINLPSPLWMSLMIFSFETFYTS